MRPAGFRTRALLILVAIAGLGLGWARSYGWTGGGLHGWFLSFTQFPVGWGFCGAFGLLVGRGLRGPVRKVRLAGLLGSVALMIGPAIWARDRSLHHLFFGAPGSGCGPVDTLLVAGDSWLRERSFIPGFWKANCTHTPLAMALGVALAALAVILGLTAGRLIPAHFGGRDVGED